MARKNEIIIHISRGGEVSLEVDGLRGPSCLELTKDLEECLGDVTGRQKKAAFHEEVFREEVFGAGGPGRPAGGGQA
jgi:hypothetical protein